MRYGIEGSGITKNVSISRAAATRTIITELNPSNIYSIELAAVNRVSTGVYSRALFVTTEGILSF